MTIQIDAIINCQLPETVPRLREAGAVLRRSHVGRAGGEQEDESYQQARELSTTVRATVKESGREKETFPLHPL